MEKLENDDIISRLDGFLSFEDEKKLILKEIQEHIKKIELMDPKDSAIRKEIKELLRNLFTYSCWNDLKSINPLEFLKKYDSYLTDEEVVNAYFSLNNFELSLEYIKYNYERLKRGFKKTILAFASIDDEGEFGVPADFEYEWEISSVYGLNKNDYNLKVIPGGYNEHYLMYLLYKYFFDDVSFIFISKNAPTPTDKLYGFFHSLDWRFLKEVLLEYYNKKDYKTFDIILRNYVKCSIPIEKFLEEIEPPFDDIKFVFDAYEFNLQFETNIMHIKGYGVTNNLVKYEKNIRESVLESEEPSSFLISNAFYANLKYLKKYPKKERIKTKIYDHAFSLFYDYLKKHFSFDISEHRYMFERLFNRIIEGASIIELLTLDNIESVYHYFKTGELVNLDNKLVSLADIKSYNTKQYKEIRDLIYSPAMAILFYDEHNFTEDAISILKFFGYDLAKKLLTTKVPKIVVTEIAKHKFKIEESVHKFKEIISSELELLKKNANDINKILCIFDYLYENNYPNLTLPKLIKRINSFDYVLLPNNYNIKDNLELLDKVSKGEPINEKLNGVTLYNEYRLRIKSSIPDISGAYSKLLFETVDMHSPEILSNGIGSYLHSNGETASSCLTPAGKASSCLNHGALSPHGRFFKVTINGRIVAYSWVWRAGNVLCFDNIEVTDEIKKYNIDEKTILDTYEYAGKMFVEKTKQQEDNPIEVILIGKNKLDVIQKPFEKLKRTSKQIKPNDSEKLYLKDSEEGEYILIGDEAIINTEEVEPKYKYARKKVEEFSSFDEETLNEKINSIYFDYCICAHEKYSKREHKYIKGYIGEDWYIGFLSDGTIDFFYRNNNPDIASEARNYLNKSITIKVDVPIIKGNYNNLDYLLTKTNYVYNKDEFLEYLNSISEYLHSISQRDYFHSPRNIKNLGKILYDGAITSSSYGNHSGGEGSNGKHFICVAEMSSDLYKSLKQSDGFIIDENICTFDTGFESNLDFKDSRYPIRTSGGPGEKQVLDYIPLSKVKAIRVPSNMLSIGMIAHLEDETGSNIPIVFGDEFKLLDKSEIKRLIKLK